MTGKTHRAGGMLCTVIGFSILQDKGFLLQDVNEGLQWLVMYPFCMWGSVASDLDHHWDSCPVRDYPSWLINKALHITKPLKDGMDNTMSEGQKKKSLAYKFADCFCASHRSWQTHSDLTVVVLIYLLSAVMQGKFNFLSVADIPILTLILMGLTLGVLTHLILDVLTPEGIWLMGLVLLEKVLRLFNPRISIPKKLHLVPHAKIFATGEAWESFIQKVLKIATVLSLVWFFLNTFYPDWRNLIPYTISFN